ERGAVVPQTPIDRPPTVSASTSAESASGDPAGWARSRATASCTGRNTSGSYPESMPNAPARYQSAGAVQVAAASPTPERVRWGGAAASTSWSTSSAAGQAVGAVRLAPLRTSTDSASE